MGRLLMLGWAVLALGCSGDVRKPPVQVQLDQVMGGKPAPGFARALASRTFRFPEDHGPHPEYATEWWYLSGNLETPQGRRFGYQFTLFRIALSPKEPAADSAWRTREIYLGHSAITDVAGGMHYSAERLSRAALELAGAVAEPLAVWLESWSLQGEGRPFPIRASAEGDDFGLDLTLESGAKPVVLQGEGGLSRKSASPGNASYYYSLTRLPTRGRLRVGDVRYRVSGESWLDREWSSSALAAGQSGWDWFALQLADNRELMFYRLRDRDGGTHPCSRGSLVGPDGHYRSLAPADVELVPLRYWHAEDGTGYPVAWRLRVPEAALDLRVDAVLDDQLMNHAVRYWEGAVDVSGSHAGRGYLELSGYAAPPAGK
ncbi:MAG: lipocalin-like domain-containing protein [Gammaproteobacteria bacterium]